MTWETIPEVDMYTDGGAEPNPGRGGFGLIMSYKGVKREFSQGFRLTTNNRMELMGVINGLERLKTKSIVNVFSDSRYVVDGITLGWAQKWKANNWYRTKTEKAVNSDLWERLLNLIAQQQQVTFNWVKGHFGHTENERCDELAMIASAAQVLLIDIEYEKHLCETTGFEFNEFQTAPTPQKPLPDAFKQIKITQEGDFCRKCGTAVINKPTKKKMPKPGQSYYFEYYLLCPACKTMYMVEAAKRFV